MGIDDLKDLMEELKLQGSSGEELETKDVLTMIEQRLKQSMNAEEAE